MSIIDVSKYQGVINWQRAAASGVTAAIVKCSGAEIGKHFTDRQFAANWTGAKAAGVKRGAYHFLHAGMDGAAQAEYYMQAVQEIEDWQPGDIIPVVDCEFPVDPEYAEIANIEDFISAIRDGLDTATILYTGAWWWGPLQGVKDFAVECPLWLAAYQGTMPKPPAPWGAVALWQHSDKGGVDGIAGHVDMNRLVCQWDALSITQ